MENNFNVYGGNFIKEIEYVGKQDVYDIEVGDNHNFICSISHNSKTGIISHNCQDLSTIQLFLLKYFKKKEGRYVFCGDVHQAIYGFAGSNSYSYQLIKKWFAPIEELELPINYRCPYSHLDYVNEKFNIGIMQRPKAPEGQIIKITKQEAINKLQAGDYLIGRKNKW